MPSVCLECMELQGIPFPAQALAIVVGPPTATAASPSRSLQILAWGCDSRAVREAPLTLAALRRLRLHLTACLSSTYAVLPLLQLELAASLNAG